MLLLFVFDAIGSGTGFVGKEVALTSVPYTRVHAVSFVSDKSMLGKFASSSQLAISAGGQTYEVQFRGEDEAKLVHDAVLTQVLALDGAA